MASPRARCSCAWGCCCTGSPRSTSSTSTARGASCRSSEFSWSRERLLLAAIPPFTAFAGKSLIESASTKAGYGWLIALFVVVAAATGGAVLRIAGRVFMGWGPAEGPDPSQTRAAHERVDETRDVRDHTPTTMMVVPAVLLVAAALVVFIPGAFNGVQRAAARFTDHAAYAKWVLGGAHVKWPSVEISHVEPLELLYAVLSIVGRGRRRRVGPVRTSAARLAATTCPRADAYGLAQAAPPALRRDRRLHRLVDRRGERARRGVPACPHLSEALTPAAFGPGARTARGPTRTHRARRRRAAHPPRSRR